MRMLCPIQFSGFSGHTSVFPESGIRKGNQHKKGHRAVALRVGGAAGTVPVAHPIGIYVNIFSEILLVPPNVLPKFSVNNTFDQ